MAYRSTSSRARRLPPRAAPAASRAEAEAAPDPRTPGGALRVLRSIGRLMADAAPFHEVVAACLDGICRIAAARRCVLRVEREELESLLGERTDAGAVELAPTVELVVSGELADLARDWQGNARPVLLHHGSRLVLPLERRSAIVLGPEGGVLGDPDRLAAMETLVDWASGVVELAADFSGLARQSEELAETRRRLQEQALLLSELIVIDELTGLYNRRYFERQLRDELERYQRYSRALSLAMIDVDHFKRINDTYGHPAGDAVLRGLAEIGRNTVRNVDLFARVGGEEFALLMPETEGDGALVACRRLVGNIRRASFPCGGGRHIRITVSIGIATVHRPWDGDPESLVRMADQALYAAKESGRDRIVQVRTDGTAEPVRVQLVAPDVELEVTGDGTPPRTPGPELVTEPRNP